MHRRGVLSRTLTGIGGWGKRTPERSQDFREDFLELKKKHGLPKLLFEWEETRNNIAGGALI